MNRLNTIAWEIAAWVGGAGLLGAGAIWFFRRKRPTADEVERARRRTLVLSGRIVDGMLLDVCELDGGEGRQLTMLLFSYRIGGVDYECSQDITALRGLLDVAQIRAGFPCSVRYQPGNPQNSIVVAEEWSGIRMGLPALRSYDHREPVEMVSMRAEAARPHAHG